MRDSRLRPRPMVEPISVVEGGFFGSAGFYVRVGVLVVMALSLFGILGLRLWSLQMIQGRHYAHVAQAQSFRTILLPAPRASIFDRSGRLLVGTQGRLGVTADVATLGRSTRAGAGGRRPRVASSSV